MHLSMTEQQQPNAPLKRRPGRRPRVPGEPVKKRQFELAASEDEDLKDVANENGTSVSEFIREAVNEAVADYREKRLFQPSRRPQ